MVAVRQLIKQLEARVLRCEELIGELAGGPADLDVALRDRVAHLDSVTEELRKLLCGQIERVAALERKQQEDRASIRAIIDRIGDDPDVCVHGMDPRRCPKCNDDDEAVGTVGVALPAKGAMRDG